MVLEARKDAETVGYGEVGEDVKEASNVIDYNINKEITKDTSSVINANNDTTTGMATVIPGVNVPKLIASTSIIGDTGGGGGGGGGSSSTFSEISIDVTAAMPSGEFNYFDNLSVDIASADVTLDADNTKLRLTAGIFILSVVIHVHKSTASFTLNSNFTDGNGITSRIICGHGVGNGWNCFTGVLLSDGNGYIRVGISPTASISNLTDSKIRLVKVG